MTERTTIPVTRETRDRLAAEKRDDETWDELLRRLSDDRRVGSDETATGDGMEFGSWSDETAERAMERLREGRGRG